MSKKAEKRIAKKLEKEQKVISKTAKQFVAPNVSKTPENIPITPAKLVRVAQEPRRPVFMTYASGHEDREGVWSWKEKRDWGDEVWQSKLKPFLDIYHNQLTWPQIEGQTANNRKRHVSYPPGTIVKEARDRLIELEKDDLEEFIFRFRMSGRVRLYGFRLEDIFYCLWFDRLHRICPSNR